MPAMRACEKEYKNAQATLQCKMPDCGTAFHFSSVFTSTEFEKTFSYFFA